MWTMSMVTVEDEGRLMPIGKVDDKGRKILEACYGDRTFGATNHPKIRIVAQPTLDYWNNKNLNLKEQRALRLRWRQEQRALQRRWRQVPASA